MRVDDYLKSLSFLDKLSPWMTSLEKSNRGEQNEEKEVTQRGARSANAQGGSEFTCQAEADGSAGGGSGCTFSHVHLFQR